MIICDRSFHPWQTYKERKLNLWTARAISLTPLSLPLATEALWEDG
jgi:hypothetical protein